MAIRTYKVTLDSKNTIAPEPVYLRQGDKTGAVVIDATLMDNGYPVSLIGLTPMFKANMADGKAVITDSTGFNIVNASGGEFTYQVPNALSAVPGKITTAYFSFSDALGTESTFDVAFIIKKAVDITQAQADDYITIIDGTLQSLQQKIDAMNTDVKTILDAFNQGDFYNKAQTDSKDAATLSSAEKYADFGDSNALHNAKTYTDNSLSGIVALPETFTNLAAIKAKYPNGANGVMVAADNGHKYIWANNVWNDAGVYQSVGIADGSIGVDKLSLEPENVLERSEKLDNKVIVGNNPDNTVSLGANQASTVFKVPFTKSGVIRFPKIQPIGWQAMAGVDKNEKITFRVDWNGLTSFSRYGYTISDDFIEIDLSKVNEVLDEVSLYVSVPTASLDTFNIEGIGTIDLDAFKSLNTEPYKNKPEKNLQELSDSFTNTIISVEKLVGKLLTGYDLKSGLIALANDGNCMTVKLEQLPKQGVLKLPQSKIGKYQLFVLLDSKGGFLGNITFNKDSGTWYENKNGVLRIDLAELYKSYPATYTLYVGYLMSDNDNWYQVAEKIASFEEVFKWGYSEPDDVLTDDNLNLPNYVPLVSGKESYIYFDNLLIGKNLYADPIPVIARNQRDDKVVLTNTSDAVHEISYDGKIVNVPIKSVPANAGSGKNLNVMVIGESTSEDGRYMTALADNFTNDVVNINFVGTRSSSGIKHEARSGWGAGTLRYVAEANGATNSFFNPSTGTFDLDYYFAKNPDVVVPDMVLLNFGINDTNRYTTNGTTETQMDHYEFFIKQFKAKNPNVIFIVGLSHSFNRWSNYWLEPQRDVIMKITKQTNEQFKERETERIFLNPQYVCLDMRLDFPHSEVPSNQFSDITTNVATNSVHPATSGYKNIALMAYNAIKYALLKTV